MLRRKRSVSFGGFGWIDKSTVSALRARQRADSPSVQESLKKYFPNLFSGSFNCVVFSLPAPGPTCRDANGFLFLRCEAGVLDGDLGLVINSMCDCDGQTLEEGGDSDGFMVQPLGRLHRVRPQTS
ncbi:unnamed protein product [Pleuronectes platessa]|uniref:Uncharacterized protein n=1 Tax=Pleuronectes platessa TaxID=8262 RepID=A0A9N7Y8W4_PLEPL|nr:unnamed protein product [Pleuronectes platessa]